LKNGKAKQSRFHDFLFHIKKVTVSNGFTEEKKMFFTGFAHRKVPLWKTGGLDLTRLTAHFPDSG